MPVSSERSVIDELGPREVPGAEDQQARPDRFRDANARRVARDRPRDAERLEHAPPVARGERSDSGALERARQRLLDGSADPSRGASARTGRREHDDAPRGSERRREQERCEAHALSSIAAGGRAHACAAKARCTLNPSRS